MANPNFNPNVGKLTQFKKGVSGNILGKAEGTKNRSTIIKKWLEITTEIENPSTGEKEKGTVEDLLIIALIKKGVSGDVSAIKEIQDTLYNKITDKVEHSGETAIVWKETKNYGSDN